MHAALGILWAVAIAGSVTSSIYCGMVVVAAARFALRRRREARVPADFTPPVSLLKPLHGTEPGMDRNLETFFEQIYPGDWELLFCARHETDEGLQLARQVGAPLPPRHARYVTCGEPMPKFHNAKVFSLARMDAEARHDLLITSDADVRVDRHYIARLIQTSKTPGSASPPASTSAPPTATATPASRPDSTPSASRSR